MTPRLANAKTCTGCMVCVDSCNHKAINSYIADDGHFYVKVNAKACIGCLLCEKICPVVNKQKYAESESAVFYAAWNRCYEERCNSASGGAFSAMAHFVLNRGGVVIGAAIEGVCDVKHILISSLDDLYRLQGSKYSQSFTVGIFRETYEILKSGKIVLFSGTGCQVGALLSFLKGKRYSGTLITIDLICGGVPSKHLLNKFIENEPYCVKRILSFRTKDDGWKSKGFRYNLKVEDSNGNKYDYTSKNNLVTTGFSTELTNRYSCYNCEFVGSHRLSDFTIGDLWGDEIFPQEHFGGLSLVVAHNHNALNLLREMAPFLHVEEYDGESAIKSNYRLISGKNVMGEMWERKYMPKLFNRCSYSTLKKIYANDYSNYSLWVVLKVIRKVLAFLKSCND